MTLFYEHSIMSDDPSDDSVLEKISENLDGIIRIFKDPNEEVLLNEGFIIRQTSQILATISNKLTLGFISERTSYKGWRLVLEIVWKLATIISKALVIIAASAMVAYLIKEFVGFLAKAKLMLIGVLAAIAAYMGFQMWQKLKAKNEMGKVSKLLSDSTATKGVSNKDKKEIADLIKRVNALEEKIKAKEK